MDKAKLNLFDGDVSHRRVGNKKHQFEYKYKSAFVEDIFDFNLEKFKRINSKILSFADNYSDMSGKVIDSMKSFIKEKDIEANMCKVNLLRTPNIGFIKSFNPVCFWFVENNGEAISENIWLEVEKNMYVSPFAEKSGFYKFNLSRNPFKIKINQFNKEKKAEIVTNIRGTISKMIGIKKLIFYFGLALSSLLVLFRIHIQAFFLWIKKFKIFPHGDSGYAD